MDKKIKSFLENVDKKFGKETICTQTSAVERENSGSLSLDFALGGGYPKGRIIEGMGWEGSGKTTLALHLAANVQKKGGRVGYIDTEHSLDLFYANKLGVDVDITAEDPKFFMAQPNNGEEALELAREFISSGLFRLIVIDSVAALVPKALIQGDVGDQKMAVIARLMSQWVPALSIVASKNNCIVYFISQFREKIGIAYGSPITTTGGNALKFYASQRLEVSRIGYLKEEEETTGNRIRVKVIKNKVSPPFKQAEFDLIYGKGISYEGEVLDFAAEMDIIKKSGSWYSYQDTKLGQGRLNVIQVLLDNPEILQEIDKKIRAQLDLNT